VKVLLQLSFWSIVFEMPTHSNSVFESEYIFSFFTFAGSVEDLMSMHVADVDNEASGGFSDS
jgi:hypothetical protein